MYQTQIWNKYDSNVKQISNAPLSSCASKKSQHGSSGKATIMRKLQFPSILSGERPAANSFPFSNTWTTVVPPRGSTNPRQPLLAIDLSLQFSGRSIPKQKLLTRFSLAASILYNLIRACAQNIEDGVWNFNEHMYPSLDSQSHLYHNILSSWLSVPWQSLIFSCSPSRRAYQAPSDAREDRPGWFINNNQCVFIGYKYTNIVI